MGLGSRRNRQGRPSGFLFGLARRSSYRSHRNTGRRKLRVRNEQLESRRLLAADVDAFRHNALDPEDVNDDGQVRSLDALMVINAMSRRGDVDADSFTDVNNDGRRSALDALRVINRMSRPRGRDDGPRSDSVPAAPDEVRSFDGRGNNPENPQLGSAGEQLLRVAEADYADGISQPAGEDRPSAREISNVLSDSGGEETLSERALSAFIYVWGQFLDHDIELTLAEEEDGEAFDIAVPAGDPLFDPNVTGAQTISLSRSEYDEATGTSADNPRQQTSVVTAFIDGSMVYGSDQETADSLRSFEGGQMLITEEGLLPTDESGRLLAGDIRAAENLSLTAMHALFVREHNRLAAEISANDPALGDEAIYQRARAIVIAEIQAITFNEFLPALLGHRAIDPYIGYDSTVDPTIANEFSAAAFRFVHSTVNNDIEFFDNDGRAVRDEIALADAFFNPALLEETGIDSILKYDASTVSQEVDLEVVDGLRDFLFGPPGAAGLDLASLNIQRGRDHGLADYNRTRAAYALEPVESFEQITSNVELQEKLAALYGDVDNIDLWVGLLAEDHVAGASLGELASAIIAGQFTRLRDGDRFWYENIFEGQDLRQLQHTTLADVIHRNTNVEGLQDNVFFMRAEVHGQVFATAAAAEAGSGWRAERGDRPGRPAGIEGVTIELLDDEGNVIDNSVTDARGNYRFRSFAETGDYQIRIAAGNGIEVVSPATLDVLISSGDVRLRGFHFEVTA